MRHRKTKVAAPTAATMTTITPQQQEGQPLPPPPSFFYSPRRLKLYTLAEIEHCETSKTIAKYIDAKTIQDKNTGTTYKTHMQSFAQFVYRRYNKTPVDNFLEQIKAGKYDPYDILTEYAGFLRNERPPNESKLTANVIRFRVKTARKFFRFNKILVTTEDFNELVPLPRKEQPPKKGIDKTTVATYLNACKNIQLKTALHVMASNGPRPIELCAVRECDVDLNSDPATITYRAEYSKMRVARTRPLTREAANQLRLWDKFKYRTRWTTVKEEETRESVRKFATPKRDPHNLLLSMPHLNGERATPEGLYDFLAGVFAELVDILGDNDGGDNGGGGSNGMNSRKIGERRKVTLKTFRDFVKSTISDLGYSDFSEWMIGHAGSTYYQKSEKERKELFRKLEPYLTYLDVASLEAKGADVETRLQEKDEQLEAVQNQLGTLFQIMAIESPEERQKKLVDAAKLWIDKGIYRAS
jgi:integrase